MDPVSPEIVESTSFCLIFYFILFILFLLIYSKFSFNLFLNLFSCYFYGFSCVVFVGCAKILKQGDLEKNPQKISQGILHYKISQPCEMSQGISHCKILWYFSQGLQKFATLLDFLHTSFPKHAVPKSATLHFPPSLCF